MPPRFSSSRLLPFAVVLALSGAILPGAAQADPDWRGHRDWHRDWHHDRHDWGHGRGHGWGEYDARGRYREPHRVGPDDRIWRGRDGRYYCRRSNGTTGLLIGAVGGALVGRTIDSGGDHAIGTILGAAGGALLGRSIDRDNVRCR